jgi:branched-chain amino acid transport system substrate-binding protein
MKAHPFTDPLFGAVTIRADGRVVHDMYRFRVKKPGESKGQADVYTLVSTIKGAEAFRPLSEGGCGFLK